MLKHKDICLDLESKIVTVKGSEVVLTAREYEILLKSAVYFASGRSYRKRGD